ncbi:MAG: nitrate- and nitrite sensing domain-containing protein [Proteobacteria bacterium]|nr:nitrate- and nitrite sensing domain-containing protein [Pseudomonadota bacterium]
MNQLLILLCKSIHAFQKERGSLCLFLSTQDNYSHEKLQQAYKNSNLLVDEILEYGKLESNKFNQDQQKSYTKLAGIYQNFFNKAVFRKQSSLRNNIQKNTIDILEITPLYTHSLIIHLTYVFIEMALFDETNTPTEISAISNFINWKERIGRERALGIVGFALNEFNSEQFTRDFKILLGEQNINKRSFLALVSKRQKQVFDSCFKTNYDIEEVHKQMESDHIPNVSATNWFKMVTKKMEMMHVIEIALIQQLDNTNKPQEILTPHPFKSSIQDVERQIILDFPFFRNLSEKTTTELFRLSNLKTYNKGSLLFLEGEPASRIYVILTGWVKIFKSTADGNETVEQMLSTGNLVIESSIFTNDKYFSSAQVSNKAKLLSFPASIYRNLLNKDLALAISSLKYLSQTSRSYLIQMDNNRLKSSKERVGWFLLKQFIAQKNPNTILLPFEKTIIASLLDMQPETFSRSLKSFKNRGLSAEKHQIQIKDIKMLCHYCDLDLQTHCQFKNNHDDCKFK